MKVKLCPQTGNGMEGTGGGREVLDSHHSYGMVEKYQLTCVLVPRSQKGNK